MNSLEKVYKELREKHGRPQGQWKLWCKRPKTEREKEEVIIGAILTQRTNWRNVELAMVNLRKAKVDSLKSIIRVGAGRLGPLIKASGFYKAKAEYLVSLAKFLLGNKKDSGGLRDKLLAQRGVGPETADSILLYAFEKPVFVIDEYTRRLVKKRGLAKNLSYDYLQDLFEKHLRRDYRLYQDFHALIVIDGKNSK